MASSSISNRLWLTYLVIVVLVLLIAYAGIIVAFQRSPLLYRQEFYRISLVNNFLKERLAIVFEADWDAFIRLFLNEVDISEIKIAVLDRRGNVIYHSEGTHLSELPDISNPQVLSERSRERILTYRDKQKNYWFYQISPINEGYYLITATERPDISISALFQDELLKPLFHAGVIAMLLSILLGWIISRWINQPIEKISSAAAEIAEGNYIKVPVEGPIEVQQLARTINEMVSKVQDSLQSQRDFVANVSHEFKTPLTSIQGFAQALYDEAITNQEGKKKAAGIIMDETDRLNRLVNDLLTLARLEAGTMVIQKNRLEVNQLIRYILEKFQFQISEKELAVETDFAGEIYVAGDGEKISQVIANIMDNAIKFSPLKSEIQISTKQENQYALIIISDSGPGIPPEDQKRIFERFFQVDKSRKGGQGRGVGLGLAIAMQIVRAHEGDIEVHSQPGKGSTFIVKLPIENDRRKKKTS